MHQYIYTSCVVSCLSRPMGGDSFYEYWMFFGRELLQPVEIKIQTGEVNLERSPALWNTALSKIQRLQFPNYFI